MDWREILLDLPHFHHDAETYQELLDELDEQSIDDMTRVREFIGIVAEKGSAMQTLRIGELKSMLHLALGNLEQALDWANWTANMNASVFSAERNNYYRCLIQSLELFLDERREPAQYRRVFEQMYGIDAVDLAWSAIQGGNPFHGLQAADESLQSLAAHQKLLDAYQKVQKAKVNPIAR